MGETFNLAALKAGLTAVHATGLHGLLEPLFGGRGAVLMFHRVRPDRNGDFAPNAGLEVTPQFLGTVVERVRARGMDIVDLDEALRRLKSPEGRRFCVFTFDDGYRDNLEFAWPMLKAAGCPFTIYIASGLTDRTADLWWIVLELVIAKQESVAVTINGANEYLSCRSPAEKAAVFLRLRDWLHTVDEDRQREIVRELGWRYGVDSHALTDSEVMDWDELRQLAADPLVTIGAHTVGHYMLSKLPLERAVSEVRDGARVIEAALGTKPRHFAYPYGFPAAAGEREFKLVADLGFASAVTTRRGLVETRHAAQPTAWPRVSVNGHFQKARYLDMFLSGAAFAGYSAAGMLRGAGRSSSA